jgi:hypothetical protein
VGALDLSVISTSGLDSAIDDALRIGLVTAAAEQLLATAQIVRKVRLALGHSNWGALEEAVSSVRGRLLADAGVAELQGAKDELDNRLLLTELSAALAKGKAQGRVGRLYLGSVDVRPLNAAIALATRLGPKTPEARQMLYTAKVVARLRACLVNEDISEAAVTLDAVRGKLLATLAMAEMRMVQEEVDNWKLLAQLSGSPYDRVLGQSPTLEEKERQARLLAIARSAGGEGGSSPEEALSAAGLHASTSFWRSRQRWLPEGEALGAAGRGAGRGISGLLHARQLAGTAAARARDSLRAQQQGSASGGTLGASGAPLGSPLLASAGARLLGQD